MAKTRSISREDTYRTIVKRSEGMYKEKGSKFIGIVVQCCDEDEAKELIANIKNEHHQARHWCYAYRFGLDKEVYRANDDGEPSNSAGAPILGQIQSFDLTNVLIVVVRYYGGTKLGVGGLINAYRTGAKEAIENAKIVKKKVHLWLQLNFEYVDMPTVMNFVKEQSLIIKKQVFEISCEMLLGLPLDRAEYVKEELDKLETTEMVEKGIY